MKFAVDDREVMRKLLAVRVTKAKAAIRKGSRAGCKIIHARAKLLIPSRTGKARQAPKVRALPRSRRRVGTQVRAWVRTGPAYYLAFVELGTSRQPAQHMLRNTAEQSKDAATRAMLDGMLTELERV